jgi:hypothetical protein
MQFMTGAKQLGPEMNMYSRQTASQCKALPERPATTLLLALAPGMQSFFASILLRF